MPPAGFFTTPLPDLAWSLLAKGPLKSLPAAPRRIRILFGSVYVADSAEAVYIWEHPYYPAYYLPLDSFRNGVLSWDEEFARREGFAQATLKVGGGGDGENDGKSTDRVLVFFGKNHDDKGRAGDNAGPSALLSSSSSSSSSSPSPPATPSLSSSVLHNLVRVEFSAADAWLEEDVRIYVHPKDPYKRVELVHSSRPVSISVNGIQVASTGGCWHLYETGLPMRFYLPVTAVNPSMLRPSDSTTECPYKGVANYYDLVLPPSPSPSDPNGGNGRKNGEVVLKDVVWFYRNPTVECAAVAGALCFYNEKVDIELDGRMMERPKTPFS